jgi:hypothetical protein
VVLVAHGLFAVRGARDSRRRVFDRSPETIIVATLSRMAMGTRTTEQPALWIATSDLPMSPGHPFYARLNAIVDAAHFDRFARLL